MLLLWENMKSSDYESLSAIQDIQYPRIIHGSLLRGCRLPTGGVIMVECLDLEDFQVFLYSIKLDHKKIISLIPPQKELVLLIGLMNKVRWDDRNIEFDDQSASFMKMEMITQRVTLQEGSTCFMYIISKAPKWGKAIQLFPWLRGLFRKSDKDGHKKVIVTKNEYEKLLDFFHCKSKQYLERDIKLMEFLQVHFFSLRVQSNPAAFG